MEDESSSPTRTFVGASPAAPLVGQTFAGRYAMLALLGRGAFGAVYRAHDKLLDRSVALKLLAGSVADAESSRARFLREARATARLHHPNVVVLHDAGEDPLGLYLVLELVTGTSLRSRLAGQPLLAATAADIAAQVAAGLAAAHALGIVHRDVKPANILIAEDGTVKIADFGVASLLGEARLTADGAVVGTPNYMAPEQVEGGEVGAPADLFALGCVLYEMLTGGPPFIGGTSGEVLARIARAQPASLPPSLQRSEPTLCALAERLLEKRPANRPSSAVEVAAALAPGVSRPSPSVRPRARVPWVWGGALLVVALASWPVFRAWERSPAQHEQARPPTPTPTVTRKVSLSRVRPAAALTALAKRIIGLTGIEGLQLARVDDSHVDIRAAETQIENAVSAVQIIDSLDGYRFFHEPNRFTGESESDRRISLSLRSMSAAGFLNLVAAATGWPLVQDSSVGGTVSLALAHVPWDTAVRTWFELEDLRSLRFGDVWLVSTAQRAQEIAQHQPHVVYRHRLRRAGPEAMVKALELARGESGVVVAGRRLKDVIIADRVDAFPAYARILTAVDGPFGADAALPRRQAYTGKRISLDLYEADIKDVFRLFADISGLNVVVDPLNSSKRVSLAMTDVPWDNVLEVILLSQHLTYRLQENVLRIFSESKAQGEPVVETVTLRNEDPELFRPFARLLTPAGSLHVDAPSRTLIIKDVREKAAWLRRTIGEIDRWPDPR